MQLVVTSRATKNFLGDVSLVVNKKFSWPIDQNDNWPAEKSTRMYSIVPTNSVLVKPLRSGTITKPDGCLRANYISHRRRVCTDIVKTCWHPRGCCHTFRSDPSWLVIEENLIPIRWGKSMAWCYREAEWNNIIRLSGSASPYSEVGSVSSRFDRVDC